MARELAAEDHIASLKWTAWRDVISFEFMAAGCGNANPMSSPTILEILDVIRTYDTMSLLESIDSSFCR
jgi:hypothetical protein